MPDWKQTLKSLKPSPLFLFGLTMMSIPVGYILKKHLDWKPRPDSKKRMLIHHGVFWLACIPALKCFHNTWRYFEKIPNQMPTFKPGGFWPAMAWMGASMGTLIGSFEGGGKLARYLVPRQPAGASLPMQSSLNSQPSRSMLNVQSVIPASYVPATIRPIPTHPYYRNILPSPLYINPISPMTF